MNITLKEKTCLGCGQTFETARGDRLCLDCDLVMAENMIDPTGLSAEAISHFFNGCIPDHERYCKVCGSAVF